MSALEEHWQDDEERARQQGHEPEHKPVSPDDDVHKEGDRNVGDHGEEQGNEPPRGDSDADRAAREQEESVEHGRETPA